MPIHRLTTADDDRLADYTRLTDVALRAKHEPAKGLYIAESSTVIRRAVAAGHRPRSLLMAERWLTDFDRVVDPVDLRARVAGVVVSLATGPHRVQSQDWQAMTRARLDLAEQWLAHA